MAEINVGVNKTNDPSYLGASQGTDRASLQPLASVPDLSTKTVTPDYQANTTAGKAVKGIGDLGEAAIKLTDAVIQQKADDTLTSGLEKIRNEFGVAAAAKMGAEDNAGRTSLQADGPAVPVAVNRLGNRLEGLTEQYNQGGLSNSAFYAKAEAFVREVKTQYKGYDKEIDSLVATKLGVTPANALRSSILSDVTELQKKVQSLQDKRTTWEHSKMAAITEAYGPNYFTQPKPPMAEVEAKVARIEARDADVAARRAALGLRTDMNKAASDDAADFATRTGSLLSQQGVNGLTNSMGIKGTQDLKDYLDGVRNNTRQAPTADEAQTLKGVFAQAKAQITNAYHQQMNTPTSPNSTSTPASILRDQTQYDAGLKVALSGITNIEDGLLNEKHGVVGFTAAYNKDVVNDASRRLLTAHPDSSTLAAIPKVWGDNALSTMFASNMLLGEGMTVLRAAGLGHTANGKPAIEFMKTATKDDPSGVANWEFLQNTVSAITKPEKVDPSLTANAVKTLYGEGNMTAMQAYMSNPKAQFQFFSDATSPDVTKAMAKRSTAEQNMYTNWAERSFASVFQRQASDINQGYNDAAAKGRIELAFNPKSETFEYVPKKLSMVEKLQENLSGRPPGLPTGAANATLAPLNTAIKNMKEVLKLEGKSTTDFLRITLPQMALPNNAAVLRAFNAATNQDNASGVFPATPKPE